MVSVSEKKWLQNKLESSLGEFNIKNIKRIGLGNGALSKIFQVQTSNKSLIVKKSLPDDDINNLLKPFLRESKTYKLFNEHYLKINECIPKHYYSEYNYDNGGLVIIEDLTEYNARTSNALKGLDIGEIKAALKSIATIHSLYAGIRNNQRCNSPLNEWLLTEQDLGLQKILEDALQITNGIIKEQYSYSFSKNTSKILEKISVQKELKKSIGKSKLVSVCHGDLWSNNIMYYKRIEKTELLAFIIDWQFTTWGNPLIDVAFLIISSLETAQRKNEEQNLLKYYYQKLIETEAKNLDYKFVDCQEDYHNALRYGALMTMANLQTFTNNKDKLSMGVLLNRLNVIPEEFLQ